MFRSPRRNDQAPAGIWVTSLLVLALGACVPRPTVVEDERTPYGHLANQPDTLAHLPPFTRAPVRQAGRPIFSRSTAVAIALREWEMFGRQQVPFAPSPAAEGERSEAAQAYWQRIGEYWWLGLPVHERRRYSTGIHDSDGHAGAGSEARDP